MLSTYRGTSIFSAISPDTIRRWTTLVENFRIRNMTLSVDTLGEKTVFIVITPGSNACYFEEEKQLETYLRGCALPYPPEVSFSSVSLGDN